MNALVTKLKEMREFGGAMRTPGLGDAQIESASARHPELVEAIEAGYAAHIALRSNLADVLRMDEAEQIAHRAGGLRQFLSRRRRQSVRRPRRARSVGRHAERRGHLRRRRLRHAAVRPHAQSRARTRSRVRR